MKKFAWIVVLLAVLALVFTGCPGEGDKPAKKGKYTGKWYLTDTEGGDPISGNQITLTANGNVYVYFDAPKATFNKIKLTYNVNPGTNLTYAALYDTYQDDTHTWGIKPWETKWLGGEENVVAEIDPATYGDKWSQGTSQDGRTAIDRKNIIGICVNFDDIETSGPIVFKLVSVNFTGLGSAPPDTTPLNVSDAILFTNSGATVPKNGLFELVADGADKAIKILPDPANGGKFKIKIDITNGQIGTFSELKFEWKTTPAASGNERIDAGITSSGGFTWFSKEDAGVGSPATYDFIADVPSWTDGWGDAIVGATCTSVEFEFDPEPAGKYTVLYLKKINFAGERESPPQPGDAGVIFDGSEGGFVNGASVKPSSFVTTTANNITIAWNPNDGTNSTTQQPEGAFRGEIQLSSAAQIDLTSGYSKFGMEWTAGSFTGGSFNISLYFPSNRMLSKIVNSGSATFNFVSDHPNWAAGTDWGGAAVGTITGFEIWSGDEDNFGSGNLVITKIWFE